MAKKKKSKKLETVTLSVINLKRLVIFLKKFGVVDPSVMLEISEDHMIAKSFKDDHSVVKLGSEDFADIFELPDGQKLPEDLKIGIYGVEGVAKMIAFLNNEEVTMVTSYQEAPDKDGDRFSTSQKFKTSSTTLTIPGAEKKNFGKMTSDEVEAVFDTEDSSAELSFDSAMLEKITKLTENETKKSIKFVAEGEEVRIETENFKTIHTGENAVREDITVVISRENFKYLDKETYIAYLTDNAIIFISQTSGSKICIAALESVGEDE